MPTFCSGSMIQRDTIVPTDPAFFTVSAPKTESTSHPSPYRVGPPSSLSASACARVASAISSGVRNWVPDTVFPPFSIATNSRPMSRGVDTVIPDGPYPRCREAVCG